MPTESIPNARDEQTQKLFFLPTVIFVAKTGYGYTLKYILEEGQEPNRHSWAGRVLPGQSFNHAVATEVHDELGYAGRLSVQVLSIEGYVKDKKGREYP